MSVTRTWEQNYFAELRDLAASNFDPAVLAWSVARSIGERVRAFARAREVRRVILSLSKREKEIAHLVALGLCNKEIARRLGIRGQTVRNELTIVLRKTAARNRTELAVKTILAERAPSFLDQVTRTGRD